MMKEPYRCFVRSAMASTVVMPSMVIVVTAVYSLVGFLLNSTVLYFVVKLGKYRYHRLFGAILAICAIWDLGVFMMMVRNPYEGEQILYGYLVTLPCMFLPVLIYHFTCEYIGLRRTKTILLLWIYSVVITILLASGLAGRIDGVTHFSWGNIYKGDERYLLGGLVSLPVYYFATGSSCWFLYKARGRTDSLAKRRHLTYLFAAFIALSIALVKVVVVLGIDLPYLLPAGMLLNDMFVALVGVAIIKHSLFDITVIVKKTAIYSLLAAVVILMFSVSEHLITTYLVHLIGSHTTLTHILSLALVIALFMPIKQRIEHAIDGFFTQKKLEVEF
jgi:hypothetical protein